MASTAAPTGGQSRPGGRSVLVTPGGVEVGSARIPGGGGASGKMFDRKAAEAAARKAREAAAKKAREAALKKAREDALRKSQENARRQREKIIAERLALKRRGAKTIVKLSRNLRGQQLRITETRKGSTLIRETRNLASNKVTINRFAVGRAGGGRRFTGGVVSTDQREKPSVAPVESKKQITIPDKKPIVVDRSAVNKLINQERLSQSLVNRSFTEINKTLKKDIKLNKTSASLLNLADIVSGGAITERTINKDQGELNSRIIKFNEKFGGKELSESQFTKANAEQNFIDSEQVKIDNRTNNLTITKRNSINTFFANLNIQKEPRLTVSQQDKVEKARKDDKALQSRIVSNQPKVNKIKSEIKANQNKISELRKQKGSLARDLKLFRLSNKNNKLNNQVSQLNFTAPPKIIAGTFPVIPASIPSGITKIKFLGKQKVGKDGKVTTDIFFQTNKGRTGTARGIRGEIGKDGKTVELVVGRSGKVTVGFPTGKERIKGVQTFVSSESVSTKSKALETIVKLTKGGEITSSKAQTLRQAIKSAFKGDAKKISLKNAKKLAKKFKFKKIKSIDLKKNLARLKRRGLIGVKKTKFEKVTKGRKGRKIKPLKLPSVSFRKIAKKAAKEAKVFDKIAKKDFVSRIKSFRKTGDITAAQEKRFLKRINRLARKGDIPKIQFLNIAKNIKKPSQLIKDRKLTFDTRLPQLDLQKNIAALRKRGAIPLRKSKVGKKTAVRRKPKVVKLKPLDLAANLKRLQKRKKFIKAAKDSARDPNFNKIIKRIRAEQAAKVKQGILSKAKDNLRVLEQRGVGKSVTFKGKKIFQPRVKFPSGKVSRKLVKPISKDEFTSISTVLTRGDISAIIGKSITRGKDKSEFIGLIKGASKATGSTGGSLKVNQQFSNALKKVLKVTADAIAKAEKTSPATKAVKVATAAAFLSKTALSSTQKSVVNKVSTKAGLVKSKTVSSELLQPTIVKSIQASATRLSTKQKSLQQQISDQRQKAKQLTKQKSKQLSKQKTKAAQKQILRIKQKVSQLQKQKSLVKQKQKQITKQIQRGPGIAIPKIPPFFLPPVFKKFKARGVVIKKKKGKRSFDVFARAVGTKKLVKINQVPLSKMNAQDLRNFVIDTSLSARGKIKARAGKPKKSKLRVPSGFAKRTFKKFRRTRSIKGRKVPLAKGSVIERRGKRLDTKGERRKITLAKRIAQLKRQAAIRSKKKKPVKRKVVKNQPKKSDAARRSQLLNNLKKARIVRARNLARRQSQSTTRRTKFRRIISTI